MRKLLLLGAIALAAGACSSDDVSAVGPDPQSCTKASIKVGDTKTGSIDSNSCAMYDWYWEEDSVNFESYNVTLQQGKGYLFTLGGDEPAERQLGLVSVVDILGELTSNYVAVQSSDDDSNPAQLFFVAPTTGTYSLRVFNDDVGESFDYSLSARECTPRAVDVVGAFSSDSETLSSDDCALAEPYFNYMNRGGDWSPVSSHIALYTIHFDGYSPRTITVKSDDFAPAFMVEGPGFDAWCNTYYCSGDQMRNDARADSVSRTMWVWTPGTYTLTVGSVDENETGTFSVDVSEPLNPDALPLRLPPDFSALQNGQHRKMTGPR